MIQASNVRAVELLRRLGRAVWPPVTSASSGNDARLTQAKLFAEIARRVDRPLDVLPEGDATLVSSLLWQRAAAFGIAASGASKDGTAGAEARALLERLAGGSESLALVEASVRSDLAMPGGESVEATRVATLKSFSERLIDELERPARTEHRQRVARTMRVLVAIAIVGTSLWLVALWTRPPDLVPGARRSLSSQFSPCYPGQCGDAVFHTALEANPWVAYDLGAPRRLHSIDVQNRTDCCRERAVPLVVETSNDQKTWTEQARTSEPFVTWSANLRGRARYVRLRAATTTHLHLKAVGIR
jgi:hypothetical protein